MSRIRITGGGIVEERVIFNLSRVSVVFNNMKKGGEGDEEFCLRNFINASNSLTVFIYVLI